MNRGLACGGEGSKLCELPWAPTDELGSRGLGGAGEFLMLLAMPGSRRWRSSRRMTNAMTPVDAVQSVFVSPELVRYAELRGSTLSC